MVILKNMMFEEEIFRSNFNHGGRTHFFGEFCDSPIARVRSSRIESINHAALVLTQSVFENRAPLPPNP
jgi:hypothetical protein